MSTAPIAIEVTSAPGRLRTPRLRPALSRMTTRVADWLEAHPDALDMSSGAPLAVEVISAPEHVRTPRLLPALSRMATRMGDWLKAHPDAFVGLAGCGGAGFVIDSSFWAPEAVSEPGEEGQA